MVPKAAKAEEVGLDSSLSNGATGASNPLAFDELTDIIRCAPGKLENVPSYEALTTTEQDRAFGHHRTPF